MKNIAVCFLSIGYLLGCGATKTLSNSPAIMKNDAVEKTINSMSVPVHVNLPTLNNAVGLELAQVSGSIVEIGLDSIVMNGQPILALQAGEISSADCNGYMVPRIFEAASNEVDEMKHLQAMTNNALESPSKPEFAVLLFVDQQVPSITIRHVLYNLGQAQISEFYFVVNDSEVPIWTGGDSEEGRILSAIPAGSTEVSLVNAGGEKQTGSLDSMSLMTVELLDGDSLGCSIQHISINWNFGQMMALSDQLFGLGAERIVLAGDLQEERSVLPIEQVEPFSSEVVFVDFIPVIPVFLPRIGIPREGSEKLPECSLQFYLENEVSKSEESILDRLEAR